MKRYDCMLLLSGGKDSCYLAYQLVRSGKRVLAYTKNVGFMSEHALNNIRIVTSMLQMDHIMVNEGQADHRTCISRFFHTPTQDLSHVCGDCTWLTVKKALEICVELHIPTMVNGFTKYSFSGLRPKREKTLLKGNVIYFSPYVREYNLPKMIDFLEQNGIITDPTATNCRHLRDILKAEYQRFGKISLEEEYLALLNEGQIDQIEYQRLKEWIGLPG